MEPDEITVWDLINTTLATYYRAERYLMECPNWDEAHDYMDDAQAALHAALYAGLIELGVPFGTWIEIGDYLPANKRWVLVLIQRDGLAQLDPNVGQYEPETGWRLWCGREHGWRVTHWQAVPETEYTPAYKQVAQR